MVGRLAVSADRALRPAFVVDASLSVILRVIVRFAFSPLVAHLGVHLRDWLGSSGARPMA